MRTGIHFSCAADALYLDSRNKRQKKKKSPVQRKTTTVLDILTKNLDPDLIRQVKESWVDPKSLCVQHLLGNGEQ